MFSLVATLAFGSLAMANSVDVETVEAVNITVENVEIKTVESSLKTVLLAPCHDAAYNQYELIVGDGPDSINLLNALVNYYCHKK